MPIWQIALLFSSLLATKLSWSVALSCLQRASNRGITILDQESISSLLPRSASFIVQAYLELDVEGKSSALL
jgi:hypothetical protein